MTTNSCFAAERFRPRKPGDFPILFAVTFERRGMRSVPSFKIVKRQTIYMARDIVDFRGFEVKFPENKFPRQAGCVENTKVNPVGEKYRRSMLRVQVRDEEGLLK